jgi:SAM-dependent methyltransferase
MADFSAKSDDLEPQTEKVGQFEWIVGFESISQFLSPIYTGVVDPFGPKCKDEGGSYYRQTVLVIGCGTSTLSQDIAEYKPEPSKENPTQNKADFFRAKKVLSIDNDPNMISYMRRNTSNECMEWMEYDIVENTGALNNPHGRGDDYTEHFDLIIDKGTLDAILVEGSVYTVLLDIHRLLRTGGAYIITSIFGMQLLKSLFTLPLLVDKWDVTFHSIDNSELTMKTKGTVIICKKMNNNIINPDELQVQEKDIMDIHFQNLSPLLTDEYEENIKLRFKQRLDAYEKKFSVFDNDVIAKEKHNNSNRNSNSSSKSKIKVIEKTKALPPSECYKVLFTEEEEALGYDFDLFKEDFMRFQMNAKDCEEGFTCEIGEKGVTGEGMTLERCLEFMRTMQ